ncbi:ABC transporter permease [Micromonospora carbonacea]|uniref:ABC transporter permease n=1 Tax=Micromonospora carbonacea TaxID=47853 RepID=A0A7H8XK29_9ACTN|nr:ABC transporter permease [Micromonospora carbonacea]MBB5826770.1 putative ABC transport system permease protein [Micromonospora carbonacea]QLD25366.1 ABC transporter permease [Micromonospora carbonacea]
MTVTETIRFALRGVAANKLRSALTMLGILIGVAAVILLVAVGNGSAQAVTSRIEALGTNTLTVTGASRGSGPGGLTVEVADALADPVLAPGVRSVSPLATTSTTVTYEGADHEVAQFVGTRPGWFAASNSPVAAGAAFTADDEAQGRRVVVIGQTVADELFAGLDPVGRQVTAGGALFTVVGVLAPKSSTGFQDANDTAVAPLSAVREVLTGYGPISSILVEAADPGEVDAVQAQISTVLAQRLPATGSASAPYRIQNAAQLLQTQTETADTFTTLLGAVAAISLLVGGIGITNIMLVTVTERTREIGIRKALGARRRTVLTQFLIEATLLSLLGGALGVAAALLGSRFTIVGVRPVIVPSSVALALGVSIAIGLFFGGLPAARAARLRPIDALRYE